MIAAWRRWPRRKWLLLALAPLPVILAFPAPGSTSFTDNQAFTGQAIQGGSSVTTIHVSSTGANPSTFPASAQVVSGGTGNTGTGGSSIKVTVSGGTSTACLTSFNTPVQMSGVGTAGAFPTPGNSGTWTFQPFSNTNCSGQTRGTAFTLNVTYALSSSP